MVKLFGDVDSQSCCEESFLVSGKFLINDCFSSIASCAVTDFPR